MAAHQDPRYEPLKRVVAKELYEKDNLSVRGVAAAMSISVARAYALLDDAGVEFRPQGHPKKDSGVRGPTKRKRRK